MGELGPRFCPRCGTERVAGMAFCPGCGLNLDQVGASAAASMASMTAAPAPSAGIASSSTTQPPETLPFASHAIAGTGETRSREVRLPALVAILIVLIVVVLALGGGRGLPDRFGRPGAAASAEPSPTPAVPTFAPTSEAPPVGLAILSPLDGAVVGSHQVTVIGSAPAGLQIVHDVPMWFDSRTTADGTGHWAMTVDLNKGENRLKFRIGDDKSTAKEVRVIYAPAGG